MDPYVGISGDFQVYVRPQAEVNNYSSASDNEQASSALSELRDSAHESDKSALSILVESLPELTKVYI